MNLPKVAIVGRMNVGKSTLFNRLSVNAKSLTFDFEGVTRDVIKDVISWAGHTFELVDTGGLSFKKLEDPLLEKTRSKALAEVETADLLLLVVDGTVGLTEQDREIANYCRKLGKKIILAINKGDSKLAQEHQFEFNRLGINPTILLSAIHGRGIDDLLGAMCQSLPAPVTRIEQEDPSFKIVILGKPNVGKSSLLNLLLQQERAIVSDIAGTTREPIAQRLTFYNEDILLTDTPGIRRKKSVKETLETMMVKSAFRAFEHGDIVILLIDASSKTLVDQELKLAFYVFENYKSLIILFNKEDLIDEPDKKEIIHNTSMYDYFLDKIPQMYISCKTGKNVGKIMPLVKKVWQRMTQELSSADMTVLIKDALYKRPLYHKTQLLRVFGVSQINKNPLTILLVVNEPIWFGSSQKAFIEKILRETYDLVGVPIKFLFKKAKG